MIKEAFFPTFIYGKDLQLDNKYFEREIVEWFDTREDLITRESEIVTKEFIERLL